MNREGEFKDLTNNFFKASIEFAPFLWTYLSNRISATSSHPPASFHNLSLCTQSYLRIRPGGMFRKKKKKWWKIPSRHFHARVFHLPELAHWATSPDSTFFLLCRSHFTSSEYLLLFRQNFARQIVVLSDGFVAVLRQNFTCRRTQMMHELAQHFWSAKSRCDIQMSCGTSIPC